MSGNINLGVLLTVTDDDEVINMLLSSSSSSSEEETEIITKVLTNCSSRNKRVTIPKYVIDVVPRYSDEVFRKHFRVLRSTFQMLSYRFGHSTIYTDLLKTENSRCNIDPEKHLLTFLWFVGNQVSFRDVADRFDLSISSVHYVVTRVLDFINELLAEFISFPTENVKQQTKNFYYAKRHFPNIIGSIDGSHIRIDKPSERPTDYINRKDYYSIVLQGVCDEQCRFLDIFVGFPGSVHDARVLRNSPFYACVENLCEGGSIILGDSAYPLLPQLVTPYRDNGHLTPAQKYFNVCLSSCRVSIEHAFGLLKQRFRQLYNVKLRGQRRICKLIAACCILHNLTIEDKMPFGDENEYVDEQPDTVPLSATATQHANSLRDSICRQLQRKRPAE